ncbi:uncharacterized protein C8Q71DRAFT_853136 [Rhodofomes roseus]|uniref:Uncharacterized protein n=1 Tax=Rhodofomes roseus TaxID=34475 RepID=A0ABQ8KUE4_9APHY|nr:uncharacterized protein C8Q71DRAFT_853136 [Rhodofomes roseus]KAH9842594.1 hypothetical protein C8Q71DRAFT_853136 [Rhodofomes roseus]
MANYPCRRLRLSGRTHALAVQTLLERHNQGWLPGILAFLASASVSARSVQRSTRRVPKNAVDGVQDYFIGIARGLHPWVHPEPAFLVFERGSARQTVKGPHAADWARPGSQARSWAPAHTHPFATRGPTASLEYISLEDALDRFTWACKVHTFHPNLDRRFFVWVDKGDALKDSVLLAWVDWDEDVAKRDDELLG